MNSKRYVFEVEPGVTVERGAGGWSGTFRGETTRPFAVRTPSGLLVTKTGAVRTFETVRGAKAAYAKFKATIENDEVAGK